jgi:hypothetical protein
VVTAALVAKMTALTEKNGAIQQPGRTGQRRHRRLEQRRQWQ